MKSNSNFVCPVCGTNKKIGVNHEHQLRLGNQDIKESLLALGIDLDESLIDRMHRNLGAGLSFDAMARASGVINSRDEQSRLEKSDVSFRHWSPGNEDNLNASIEDEAYPLLQVMYSWTLSNLSKTHSTLALRWTNSAPMCCFKTFTTGIVRYNLELELPWKGSWKFCVCNILAIPIDSTDVCLTVQRSVARKITKACC